MSSAAGRLQVAEALAERVDGLGDVVERERRLRDHRDRLAARVELRARPRATRSRPSTRAARRASRSPRRGRRGRRARPGGRCRRSAAPRRAPSRRAGRRRRRRAARADSQFSRTDGATPCAERTQIAPAGISSSWSTKTAPSPSSRLHDVVVVDDLVADVDRRRRAARAGSRRSRSRGRRRRRTSAARRAGPGLIATTPSRRRRAGRARAAASEAVRTKPRGERANARAQAGPVVGAVGLHAARRSRRAAATACR